MMKINIKPHGGNDRLCLADRRAGDSWARRFGSMKWLIEKRISIARLGGNISRCGFGLSAWASIPPFHWSQGLPASR